MRGWLVALCFLAACSSGGWSAEDRAEWLDACDERFPSPQQSQQANVCFCIVDYLEENYSPDEVDRGAVARAAQECR